LAAVAGHVCPGIRIHALDIDQPPGIGISPIADIDVRQMIVNATLTANTSTANTSPQDARKAVCRMTHTVARWSIRDSPSSRQKRGARARHSPKAVVVAATGTILAAVDAGIGGRASTVLRASIAPK